MRFGPEKRNHRGGQDTLAARGMVEVKAWLGGGLRPGSASSPARVGQGPVCRQRAPVEALWTPSASGTAGQRIGTFWGPSAPAAGMRVGWPSVWIRSRCPAMPTLCRDRTAMGRSRERLGTASPVRAVAWPPGCAGNTQRRSASAWVRWRSSQRSVVGERFAECILVGQESLTNH